MKVSYYPGCSLEGTALDYAASIAGITPLLDMELEEIEDWNCCGATAAHSINHKLSLALPARNLARAEKAGHDVVAPCALCFNRLKMAEKALLSPEGADLGVPYGGSIKIWDLLDYLTQTPYLKTLAAKVVKPLRDLKAVGYYGCMVARPPWITDKTDCENPQNLERLLKVLGATPLDWSYKTDCCGAGLAVSRPDIIDTLVQRLFDRALRAGAECFVVYLPDVPGQSGHGPGAHLEKIRQGLLPAGDLFHRTHRPGPGAPRRGKMARHASGGPHALAQGKRLDLMT